MTVAPRYNFPTGTEISLHGRELVVSKVSDTGYELAEPITGGVNIMGFAELAELARSGAMTFENPGITPQGSASLRLKGLSVAAQLSEDQQKYGRFHYAICIAVRQLQTQRIAIEGRKTFRLSIRELDKVENRKFIRPIVEAIFGERVHLGTRKIKGGCQKAWFLYKGRTLKKYHDIFEALPDDDDPIAALATLDHLKGNETSRLPWRLKELMTQAWEEMGLDLKGRAPANVLAHLEALVTRENETRALNQLNALSVPSQMALVRHRKELLTPTEYLVATKGERFVRNKRGRGSTDLRALMIAEFCEMDECKPSLVTSAKTKGYWHCLSENLQSAMEWADKEIRRRFCILVLLDVATRMPLAWVISDQPKAEATLQLLRMATRDKTREKRIYGCEGDPMPALSLGMVRNDNGSGLRNSVVKTALLGVGAAITDVRTHAAADKPYVERMFGTTESMLFKLLHGYTGRKPGELPGYDANAAGVLDVDLLYEILTKFFIDEYPSLRHMGVGMGGRRPAEVYKEINATRGIFKIADEDRRRVHLGWKFDLKPNDEGVRVLSGLFYSSDTFQQEVDNWPGKVSVFIDPDNLNFATAVIPGRSTLFRLALQTTVFADLTVSEFLELMESYRREDPETTALYEDRIAKVRIERFELLKKIGVERRLPRSYVTIEEAKAKARVLFSASRIVSTPVPSNTVAPGSLANCDSGPGVLPIGNAQVIDQEPTPPASLPPADITSQQTPVERSSQRTKKPRRLGRPDHGGEFS
ncbi:hypothetical protein VWY34_13755 [Phaeobacter sp. JH20_02]|uniref:hypothetical protein n=1 Tax=unclassified Phaeobacter TaxID=2621772 RepID=UPI003A86C6C8